MNIQKIKGTKDYYNKTQQQMDFVVSLLEKAAKQYGYGKITFPTIEKLELFKRTAGESSDIVSKEMFSFLDRKDRELALRPEGTASATRLVLENKLVEQGQRFKAFYTLPMYRYERPQKGRQREF
ncbi:MAG: histidine--tRNA ligase, partial [Tenericutes bacterium]